MRQFCVQLDFAGPFSFFQGTCQRKALNYILHGFEQAWIEDNWWKGIRIVSTFSCLSYLQMQALLLLQWRGVRILWCGQRASIHTQFAITRGPSSSCGHSGCQRKGENEKPGKKRKYFEVLMCSLSKRCLCILFSSVIGLVCSLYMIFGWIMCLLGTVNSNNDSFSFLFTQFGLSHIEGQSVLVVDDVMMLFLYQICFLSSAPYGFISRTLAIEWTFFQ